MLRSIRRPAAADGHERRVLRNITLDFMMKKMQADPSVCMITSGTPTVLGFTEEMRKKAGRQFIDVGIAEENAVALASGIAANGGKPVYGVYSTFIQRAYDQISQDLCINSNAATIIVAWGSVYGMNDVTHLGLYDIRCWRTSPTWFICADHQGEYLAMLDWSIEQNEHPSLSVCRAAHWFPAARLLLRTSAG
ncbi:MAG: hypothetical protein ACLRVN_07460 [Butyricicoccus sp.]